ncbi:PepSY-associated TM helix domain-containing protein [Parahaliea aestuarii]|uniref:PepSY domain-containing protein n=1 Tax=Parahaliea aestuarii TaxID=1852021 RepID=A0A5C8ZTL7_9GAMM|nr:PepSY-associated TM helix domain-containing protein [Parahaliea aestuarii]TXS90621.1 PepSY domain-containing protein [Parahaliea aestuarii]
MIKLSQERTRRLIAVHGWSAVICGLFLYVVVLTGAVAVLVHEIGAWSVGGSKVAEPMAAPVDATLRELIETVPEAQREDVSLFGNAAGEIVAYFHTHQQNPASGNMEDFGTLMDIDPRSGEVLRSREDYGSEVFNAGPGDALDRFIVDLHVNLHLPEPWGLYATGILGLVMLVAAISGLLIHRHLIKDAFVAPRPTGALLEKKDRHVLAGTWGLVFGFVLAFTGSFFSFATALGLPLVAITAFGGDQVAALETLSGTPEASDPAPVPMANLDAIHARSAAEAGSVPQFTSVSHWGRADSQVLVFHAPSEGELTGTTNLFDGATGEFLGVKPSLGTVPSAGTVAFDLMGPLHFGHFAGLLSKIVWVCLGLAMCYVTITGLQLWLQRREEDPLWRRLASSVEVVAYGTPIGLAGAAHVFFLSYGRADTHYWVASGFIGFSLLTIALGLLLPRAALHRTLAGFLGALFVLLPFTRMLLGGTPWAEALAGGNGVVVAMDCVMVLSGVICCRVAAGLGWMPRFAALTPRAAT